MSGPSTLVLFQRSCWTFLLRQARRALPQPHVGSPSIHPATWWFWQTHKLSMPCRADDLGFTRLKSMLTMVSWLGTGIDSAFFAGNQYAQPVAGVATVWWWRVHQQCAPLAYHSPKLVQSWHAWGDVVAHCALRSAYRPGRGPSVECGKLNTAASCPPYSRNRESRRHCKSSSQEPGSWRDAQLSRQRACACHPRGPKERYCLQCSNPVNYLPIGSRPTPWPPPRSGEFQKP